MATVLISTPTLGTSVEALLVAVVVGLLSSPKGRKPQERCGALSEAKVVPKRRDPFTGL